MHICTIAARNYVAQARLLARSYAEYNRGESCSVLVLDDPEHGVDETNEPFEIVRPEQLGLAPFSAMAAMYEARGLAAAVKPSLLRHLLDRDGQPLAYVDPDVFFFDEIDEIAQLAAAHELVLAPRVLREPLPRDGREPSERALLTSGTYSLSFIALTPGAAADRLIDWWSEGYRGTDWPTTILDQRRFDLVGSIVPDFHVLRDPGANVSYWNLHERRLERQGDSYRVDGSPLRFFHFSGFDPDRPFALSERQSRVRLADEPILARLCDEYATALHADGLARGRAREYPYDKLYDGTPLSPFLRTVYTAGVRDGAFHHSPFTKAGTDEFVAWCHEPDEPGGKQGLTRLCLAMYRIRPDLRQAFPDLDGTDGPGFITWAHDHGLSEFQLAPHLLPPKPAASDPASSARDFPWGVNVAGYLRSELGVGEIARAVVTALDAREFPVMPVHGRQIPHSRQGHPFAHMDTAAAPFPINLICVNADHLASFLADEGPNFTAGRYNIGFWWWEVLPFPESAAAAFDLVDEVWVGTDYVGEALRPLSPVPVVKVRIPVATAPAVPCSRADLGLPAGFLFLFMFDFNSVFARKDPLALIEAFRLAFEPAAGASLVIKCINQSNDPDNYDRLQLAAGSHPDIHIIDRYVSHEQRDAMLAACDCYVSLHRAEGFGLPLAEAMYLGKPVIATRYSGNLEFMTDANSYLVDYELRQVGEGNPPYPADGRWAAADPTHAARLMREVFEEPAEAQRRGRAAARDIRKSHSPRTAGETMERRLATIRTYLQQRRPLRHQGRPVHTVTQTLQLPEMLERPVALPPLAAPDRGHRILERVALRAVHTVTEHQRALAEHQRALAEHQRALAEQQGAIGEGLVGELDRQASMHAASLVDVQRRTGAQIAALLAELRRRDAELQSIRGEVAALQAQRRTEEARPTENGEQSS